MKYFYYSFFTFLFSLIAAESITAQQKDDLILKAMNDELGRNMKDLKFESFEKPFFISYSVYDVRSLNIKANYGALVYSNEGHRRLKGIRVLAGSYDFNDESLDNNVRTAPDMNGLEIPQDDDYYGIRRSFWTSTDNVYKNASRHLQRNLLTINQQKKSLSEIPHRTFAKVTPSNIIINAKDKLYNKLQLEDYVRELSSEFLKYPELSGSEVNLSFDSGNDYFVNSESTQLKIPFSSLSLDCSAEVKTEEGEYIGAQIVHISSEPDSSGYFKNSDDNSRT
jgi:TldD protein